MTYGRERQTAYGRRYRATERGQLATRRANLKASHGITDVEWRAMWDAQGGACAACGLPETGRNQYGPVSMSVDHDHVTGKIRGLLCMRCNRALGMLRDNPALISKLLSYRETNGRRVYISGGMRGYPLFNFPAFDAAAVALRSEGWTVYSPAEHDRSTGFDASLGLDMQADFDITEAFRWDVSVLLAVDAVYFLDGWERSQGANTEHAVAVSIGIQRMYETPRDARVFMYLPHVAFKRPKGARRG
jgi:hypothetical protein